MKDKLSAFWSGFKDKWSSLAKNLRIFIITAVSVVIVAAIVLAIVLNQKGYTAIYTGLDSEESSQVVSAINELGITDVKMGTDGSISVPSDQADNVRMQLSIQGYPKSTFNFDVWNSGIGIWSTDTEKKVLQIQQLQTHLMKAINTISAVKNSYVIITMPENSNYVISTDSEEPRVSVKLDLKNGAQLTSDQASAILSELPKKTRIDVVERMAKMDRASPDVVKSIERTLEKKFDNLVTADTTEVGGIDYVAEVMNNVDRATEKYIFDELTLRDPKLADDIRSKMFVFEDIVTLDNMAIQAFIPEVDSKDLAVAIKGSTPEVAECIYANMSTRMRESVQTDVEYLHNVRMRDVEEAQQRIVSIIRRLEDEGTLVISKGGKEDEIIA